MNSRSLSRSFFLRSPISLAFSFLARNIFSNSFSSSLFSNELLEIESFVEGETAGIISGTGTGLEKRVGALLAISSINSFFEIHKEGNRIVSKRSLAFAKSFSLNKARDLK